MAEPVLDRRPLGPPADRSAGVRVRFCPSPSGPPHIGLIRTALFNWAFARHTGGILIFRLEDADGAGAGEAGYRQLLEALRWLGLDWDEGMEVGGPHQPYRQSRRRPIHREVLERLCAAGYVYESFSTAEEIRARRLAAGRDPSLGYDNADRPLSGRRSADLRSEGRLPVLRFRMPDEDIAFCDLVRGRVTLRAGSVPDYVVAGPDGAALFALANPVDDALMGVTHVLRGEDLLPTTLRQIPMWRALVDLGVAAGMPLFGHLPMLRGAGYRALSGRDPEADVLHHRERGFLPEGLLNYLALRGWVPPDGREIFTIAEVAEAFDPRDLVANAVGFDPAEAEAVNAEHLRRLPVEEFRERLRSYLQVAGVLPADTTLRQLAVLDAEAPLVQTRIRLLSEAVPLLRSAFAEEFGPLVEAGTRQGADG
jgi:glutamyl-tRNA synthetase